MQRNIITGIDIGTHTVRVCVCESIPNSKKPRVLGIGSARTRGMRHGYIINRYEVAKSIRQAISTAEKSSGMRIKNVVVGIGGMSLSTHIAATTMTIAKHPETITNKIIQRVEYVLQNELSEREANAHPLLVTPLAYYVDGKQTLGSPNGMIGTSLGMKALIVAALEHHVEDFIQTIEEIGLEIESIVPLPVGTSIATVNYEQRTAGCAVVDIGAETVSIAVFERDTLISLEVFPIGSTDITNDIALGFQIALDEAEALKKGHRTKTYSESNNKHMDKIIKARLSDILDLVQGHLKRIKRDHILPAGVVFTGGGASLPALEAFAKQTLKLPVTMAKIQELKSSKKRLNDSSWYGAYGLCYSAMRNYALPSHKSSLKVALTDFKNWAREIFKQLTP